MLLPLPQPQPPPQLLLPLPLAVPYVTSTPPPCPLPISRCKCLALASMGSKTRRPYLTLITPFSPLAQLQVLVLGSGFNGLQNLESLPDCCRTLVISCPGHPQESHLQINSWCVCCRTRQGGWGGGL